MRNVRSNCEAMARNSALRSSRIRLDADANTVFLSEWSAIRYGAVGSGQFVDSP